MELDLNKLPEPAISKRPPRFSPVWLVPLVAALVGLSMLVHSFLSAGPRIVITFDAATGLEVGKTAVKYKDVTVGTVAAIDLDRHSTKVIVAVNLVKSAEHLARCGSRFWVVRPRIGAGGVSGIDTVFSGAYIGVDIAEDKESCLEFSGLESPPTVIYGTPGTTFQVHAEDLGSLDIGSPVYYRRIQVGRLATYRLNDDGNGVRLQVFVNEPYDKFVNPNTRFWNASGIDISLGSNGLKVNTQSVATLLAGGIAFDNPPKDANNVIDQRETFALAKDQPSAMAPPRGESSFLQLRFERPVKGLTTGAPVLFFGMEIGQVASVELDYEAAQRRFPTLVKIEIQADRLGLVSKRLQKQETSTRKLALGFFRELVERGLRAQVRTGNLLTGQSYVSVDFHPNAPKAGLDISTSPPTLPTLSDNNLDDVQDKIASIVRKLDRVPIESIGAHLDALLSGSGQTLEQVQKETLPGLTRTLQQAEAAFNATQAALAVDSPLQSNLKQALQELQRTAKAVRTLSEQISRNPESIIFGRAKDAPLAQDGTTSSGDTGTGDKP